jgi:hypothetical protein
MDCWKYNTLFPQNASFEQSTVMIGRAIWAVRETTQNKLDKSPCCQSHDQSQTRYGCNHADQGDVMTCTTFDLHQLGDFGSGNGESLVFTIYMGYCS